MDVSVLVDMRHDAFVVHVDHAGPVILVGQAIGCGVTAWQCEGNRRGQHAKQIGQGDKPHLPSNVSFW